LESAFDALLVTPDHLTSSGKPNQPLSPINIDEAKEIACRESCISGASYCRTCGKLFLGVRSPPTLLKMSKRPVDPDKKLEFAGMNDVEIGIALWAENLSDDDRALAIRALEGTLTEEDHARRDDVDE